MASRSRSRKTQWKPSAEDRQRLQEILGYLNFSGGTSDAAFQRNLNTFGESLGKDWSPAALRDHLLGRLEELRGASAAFQDSRQAEGVIRLTLDECLPAYRRFHSDLLFHLRDEDFGQPFFLARVFEAVLSQGGPWTETQRVVEGALDLLNDFLGYRPVAVLENEQRMEPYPHERFRPVPLYIRGAGVGCGPYRDLIAKTIELLGEMPQGLLVESFFDLERMDELALDVRAHDHLHPVNKRTNYMFGEWDPHVIDTKGFYRRFVIRKIILDALLNWIDSHPKRVKKEELLFDAAAVLCGTMLMASAVSGAGPGTHASTVTLTALLPKIARQRDSFYARLLESASGPRARRLIRAAEQTQQPFGHVRQQLNIELAKYGARQVQHRHLAQQYARMGYSEASREEAAVIPSPSARFECELLWRISAAHLHLDRGQVEAAAALISEIEDHLRRGIECGALIDPWNVLGFQGNFPLFHSREDAVQDPRAETLIEVMELIFGVCSRTLSESAAQGHTGLSERLTRQFSQLADWWDRFATTTVTDLPHVSGRDHWESASHVARALSEWRAAGEAAGDISFWRQHVDRFQSAKAYALVVEALLDKRDHVAAMGLLMQWLSEAETVGLESGPHSIYGLLIRWMKLVIGTEPARDGRLWVSVRRLFDYVEANAGELWSAPSLGGGASASAAKAEDLTESAGAADDFDDGDEEEGENLFEAAWDDVVYRDSTADGIDADVADDGGAPGTTAFEILAAELEPRLRFLEALSHLWKLAGAALASEDALGAATRRDLSPRRTAEVDQRQAVIAAWERRARDVSADLARLMHAVHDRPVSPPPGDRDSNIEYDIELQTKFDLLHSIIATQINCVSARRYLRCCLPPLGDGDADENRQAVTVLRGVLRRDAAAVRRDLPPLLAELGKRPLLYIPLKNEGRPEAVRAARDLQELIRFLLTQLPQLGLLEETWRLLLTAYRMERDHRPAGQAVTEFDALFRTALRNSLECVILSSLRWKLTRSSAPPRRRGQASRDGALARPGLRPALRESASRAGRRRDAVLIEMVGDIVARYRRLWLRHSRTTRLSAVEGLMHEAVWDDAREFIERYGGDLFQARFLTLGNLRAILHGSVERFLDYLKENEDPLHPVRLLDDLENGEIDRALAVELLELVYGSVVDKIDRFVEYNTTTTQSDYGEMFYCLLDFLRVEAAYERDAWNLMPFAVAHEILASQGKTRAALAWERVFRANTAERAARHLKALRDREKSYGMRLPAVSDHLAEQFVKPLTVNRMLALVPRAMRDARRGRAESPAFDQLRREVRDYLESTSGSSVDLPPWLRSLEAEIERSEVREAEDGEPDIAPPPVPLSLRRLRRQLARWDERRSKRGDAEPRGRGE